ncbi:MAG: YceI family protein [Oceanipulchritudo sp.]
MKICNLFPIVTFLLGSAFIQAEPLVYTVDPAHSGVDFRIRHFINKVPGTFADFNGEIHFDKETPENSKAIAVIEVTSVDTRNGERDAHLMNEDFFKAGTFPEIEFESTEWTPTGDNTYVVEGNLKMLETEKPITLDVTYLGEVEGRGILRSGWEGTATIDRTDWGITYGVPAVGKEVEILLSIQAHRPIPE